LIGRYLPGADAAQLSDSFYTLVTLNWIAADAPADEPAALSADFCAVLDDAALPDWSVLAEAVPPDRVVALGVADEAGGRSAFP
jgi:hypothetical protein